MHDINRNSREGNEGENMSNDESKNDTPTAEVQVKEVFPTIKVLYKNNFGHKFYPKNNNAELLLKMLKQSCFTEDQLKTYKAIGFKVDIEVAPYELDDRPIRRKRRKRNEKGELVDSED